ncbi:N-acetylmuramoyl-L-alanine amidase [Spirulina subsalsa FACHB-351]|uniref:N-acetylmuramoyl-L-alanine amidase n=1 Tax=Spirulina subsalsa FACHB-351 TaxID=234711 RepID=A0ABT3LB98_9CYAN|nr:N-acetylmuramoyl-L-alanine amidase [Spirulina subsalsa]MCW6038791.1 N-acetylmuramoyl-L-alanine amidase [Spirulina subsalsa FACHB-351]
MLTRWNSWILGLLGALLVALPAEGRQLLYWQFDPNQNRLTFSTDEGVQPTAQLISNPTRLVIDLPGTVLGPVVRQQAGYGGIAAIRTSQLNPNTTRIVVEVARGYTLNPEQIQFQGLAPHQWVVQLPTPQPIAPSTSPNQPLEEFQVTRNGFFLRLPNQQPQRVDIQRSRNGLQVLVDLQGITWPESWQQQPITLDRYGVKTVEFNQTQTRDRQPLGQLILNVAANSPNWEASWSPMGLSIIPQGGTGRWQEDRPSAPSLPPEEVISTLSVPPPQTPPSTPHNRVVVIIDPGHGGRDPGAIGLRGLREIDVVLPIALEVAQILQRQGVEVLMTRNSDYFVTLQERVIMANQARGTVFVSIHANAVDGGRSQVNGLETYYYTSGGYLAQAIHNSIIQNVQIQNRGVRRAGFYVLKYAAMPSVLVEVGFVTGRVDAANLANPAYRSRMAGAIAQGILVYLRQQHRPFSQP